MSFDPDTFNNNEATYHFSWTPPDNIKAAIRSNGTIEIKVKATLENTEDFKEEIMISASKQI